jgi:DNA-binding NtrC family response regulator
MSAFLSQKAVEYVEFALLVKVPFADALNLVERKYIEAALRVNGGNISQTAVYLDIHRNSLARKMKLLGVSNAGK